MSSSRNLKDDALFLGALTAILVGTGLLFETTGFLSPVSAGIPLGLVAIGGILLWLSLAKGRSAVFFGAGIFLVLAGAILLFSAFPSGISKVWPLLMSSAGIGWYAYGHRRSKRILVSFAVPAAIIVFLGLFFTLFSFRIVQVRLMDFFAVWWPVFLIGGGLGMLVAWGLKAGRPGGRKRVDRP